MKKNRRIYIGILVFNGILFCLFSNWFLLVLFAAMLVLPIILWFLMNRDVKNTEIKILIKNGWIVGQKSVLRVELDSKNPFIAAGLMDLTLQLENFKFKEKKIYEIHIPISSSNRVFEVEYIPRLCGSVELSCTQAMAYDVLGLIGISMQKPEKRAICIYPKKVPIQLKKKNSTGSIRDGEQYEKNKKGMDMTDIYDMREYIPGDNIRRVHWKLSSKIDDMVIREGSDTSHYDTMLLLDIGLQMKEKEIEKEVLSAAFETGMTISKNLLDIGIRHCFCSSQETGVSIFELSDEKGYMQMQEEMMEFPLPSQSGMGIYYAISQNVESRYTKLIYVTAGECRQELLKMSGKIDVTALSIVEGDGEIRMTQDGRCQIIELPIQHINYHAHSILI